MQKQNVPLVHSASVCLRQIGWCVESNLGFGFSLGPSENGVEYSKRSAFQVGIV